MTVQELIDKLQAIEDKTLPVVYYQDDLRLDIFYVDLWKIEVQLS